MLDGGSECPGQHLVPATAGTDQSWGRAAGSTIAARVPLTYAVWALLLVFAIMIAREAEVSRAPPR